MLTTMMMIYLITGSAFAFLVLDGYGMRNAAGLIETQAAHGAPQAEP
jgi:hypothetical protein